MNTILNIINILKHLFNLIFALGFSIAMVLFTMLAVYVNIIPLWAIWLYFAFGFLYFICHEVSKYRKLWVNKGTFSKSLWNLLTKL